MGNKKPHLDPPPCKLLEEGQDLVRLAAVHDEDSPVFEGAQCLSFEQPSNPPVFLAFSEREQT